MIWKPCRDEHHHPAVEAIATNAAVMLDGVDAAALVQDMVLAIGRRASL